MAPSLCGHFVTDKRSLIAFTWTLTCVLTFIAFMTCGAYLIHIHTTYIRIEHSYYEQWYNNYQSYQQEQQQNQNEEEGGDQQQQQQHSADRGEWDEFNFTLNQMRSGSMTLIAIYVILITTTITCYGSTAIVGFTSLRGIYIAPCFSSHDPATLSLKLGIFGGAIVLFANLLLICAVIFGEVRVEDWRNNNQKDEHNNNEQNAEQQQQLPYEIERIATVLAVTCMFLAALYSIFAILLFLYFGSKEHIVDDTDEINIVSMQPTGGQLHHHHHSLHHHPHTTMIHSTPGGALSGMTMIDPRREKFITIHNRDPNDMVGQYELT